MPPNRATYQLSQRAAFLIGCALLLVSGVVRLISYPTITSDYTYFLAKWFVELQAHPLLSAFQNPFTDYAPLYLYFLKLLTFLPVYSLWSIKTLSLGFDVCVAYLTYRLLKDTTDYSKGALFLAFSLMLSIPTVVLNSSLWAQSDAAYAFGIVGAIYFMLKEKPRFVAVCFGVAFAFKVQAIFFAPVLLGYFWRRRDSFLELVWIPAIYVLTVVPAWLSGGSLLGLLTTYAHQSGEYTSLNVSSPSVFAFIEKLGLNEHQQNIFFIVGISISALWAAVVAYVVSKLPPRPASLLFWSVLCVIAVPYFLPRMHERYFYLADILSVVYALYVPKRWFVPVIVVLASLLSYMPYLSSQAAFFSNVHVDLRVPSFMLLVSLCLLVALLFLSARQHRTQNLPPSV